MKEILKTTNLVVISAVEAALNGDDIEYMLLDTHISIMEGSIGIFPRRFLVAEAHFARATALLKAAGLGDELST